MSVAQILHEEIAYHLSGFHLEKLSRGGKSWMLRTLGGGCIGLVCSQLPRGVWGHAPPGIFFAFRPSEVISGAFQTL